jgi:hypothetical protein
MYTIEIKFRNGFGEQVVKKAEIQSASEKDVGDSLFSLISETIPATSKGKLALKIDENKLAGSISVKGQEEVVFSGSLSPVQGFSHGSMNEPAKKAFDILSKLSGETVTVVYVSRKEPLKKSRSKGENGKGTPTPESYKNIVKRTSYTFPVRGLGYEEIVNARLAKEGKQADFKSAGSDWVSVTENKLVMFNQKTGNVAVRIYLNDCDEVSSSYTMDGEPLSLPDWKGIEAEYFTLSSPSSGSNQGTDAPILPLTLILDKVEDIIVVPAVSQAS